MYIDLISIKTSSGQSKLIDIIQNKEALKSYFKRYFKIYVILIKITFFLTLNRLFIESFSCERSVYFEVILTVFLLELKRNLRKKKTITGVKCF